MQSFLCSGIRFIALARFLNQTHLKSLNMCCDVLGVATRTKECPFAATYRLAWTSRVPRRGKIGLEVLGDVKPVGEENADEKLEIIPVSDVLVRGIVLENGKLSQQSIQQLKRTLFALRFQSVIDENEDQIESPRGRRPVQRARCIYTV